MKAALIKPQTFVLHANAGRGTVLANLHAFLDRLSDGQPWQIVVDRFRKQRSDAQNAALWGCAYATLEDHTGHEAKDLHVYFCGEFFGWKVVDFMGQKQRKPVRTTTTNEAGQRDVISPETLSRMYAFIQQRAAETVGVFVPDPDPLWFQEKHR